MGNTKKCESPQPVPEAKSFITKGSLFTGKTTLNYTARAAETYIKNKKGKTTASIFTIAYLKDGVKDPAHRPVTFIFNGGPGSSAVWLHMGLLGPMRISVPSDGSDAGAPPYRIEQNPLTLLSVSDLVFIDPVGTGYSRALNKSENKDFWDTDRDTESITEFIRVFITKNKRWNSPKYICGESYGSIRAALLVGELQRWFKGIHLNGVILISPALDVRTFIFTPGNNLTYVNYLPSYAAAALYHDKLPHKPANLTDFLQEVIDFAVNEYLVALFKGDSLSEKEKAYIIDKLHRYTGLSKTYIRNSNLRIISFRFTKELLRDRGLVIGEADSRCLGKDPDNAGEYVWNDPEASSIDGAFTTAINDYLGRGLKVDFEREYKTLAIEANMAWKRPATEKSLFSGFLNVTPQLAKGVADNKDLRIFVAAGIYDLITAFYSAEYMFNQSGIPKDRITLKNYEGGHMMYTNELSYKNLAADLRDFILAGQK
jgi:carboxypeptidase C (cathepsin A)